MPTGTNPNSRRNLRPPWKKGQPSPNQGGRPKKPITDAYADLADRVDPNDKKHRTYAQRLAEAQFRAAIRGKTDAAREIANRIEGPAEKPQVEIIPGTAPLQVRINTPDLLSVVRQFYGLSSGKQPFEADSVTAEVDRGQEPPEDREQG